MQNMPSHLLNLLAVVAVVESMVAAFFERRALAAAVVAVAAWQVSLIHISQICSKCIEYILTRQAFPFRSPS